MTINSFLSYGQKRPVGRKWPVGREKVKNDQVIFLN